MERKRERTPQEVLAFCREHDVRAVDLRFTDFLGRQHHTTVPVGQLTDVSFEDGFGFDGSSIRCWQSIDESDMLLIPESGSAWIDPFASMSTLVLTCSIQDPVTREQYSRDPRTIARRAENYLISTGIADRAFFGPEAEFFIFDEVRYDQRAGTGFYEIDSAEASWNRGRPRRHPLHDEPNLGHQIRHKEGYFPTPPSDRTADLRNQMMQCLIDCGIEVECHHHEVATAGQAEIDVRYDRIVAIADTMMTFKYVVKNVARVANKTATFMPKPIVDDNGSGMHVHFSLWKGEEPLFAGNGYAGLSEMGLYAIGGLLKHAPALLALTNPTTNSYKRLVPGYEAPVNLAYSQRNRSAAIRIPMASPSPKPSASSFGVQIRAAILISPLQPC